MYSAKWLPWIQSLTNDVILQSVLRHFTVTVSSLVSQKCCPHPQLSKKDLQPLHWFYFFFAHFCFWIWFCDLIVLLNLKGSTTRIGNVSSCWVFLLQCIWLISPLFFDILINKMHSSETTLLKTAHLKAITMVKMHMIVMLTRTGVNLRTFIMWISCEALPLKFSLYRPYRKWIEWSI